VLPDTEMKEIRQVARRHQLTVGEWVRRALRTARREEPAKDPVVKLRAVREALQYSFPAPDIRTMLEEIERGYLEWSFSTS